MWLIGILGLIVSLSIVINAYRKIRADEKEADMWEQKTKELRKKREQNEYLSESLRVPYRRDVCSVCCG